MKMREFYKNSHRTKIKLLPMPSPLGKALANSYFHHFHIVFLQIKNLFRFKKHINTDV